MVEKLSNSNRGVDPPTTQTATCALFIEETSKNVNVYVACTYESTSNE